MEDNKYDSTLRKQNVPELANHIYRKFRKRITKQNKERRMLKNIHNLSENIKSNSIYYNSIPKKFRNFRKMISANIDSLRNYRTYLEMIYKAKYQNKYSIIKLT